MAGPAKLRIGYTLMTEQRAPTDLVADARLAEAAGFPFAVMSDHFHPWLEAQGHSGYAWSILGAIAAVTEKMELMTYVTCPIRRYHPAIVAQKAATIALLSNGRFRLGLGAGERLNEHVVGGGWPSTDVRHEMLEEAVEIIRMLWEGDYVTYHGMHFSVDTAKLFDLPAKLPEIGIAVSGPKSVSLAGGLADFLIATEPDKALIDQWREAGGTGDRIVGQLPVCWGTDRDACIKLAHEQFRWGVGGGWGIQADLPNPSNFDRATQRVKPEEVAEEVPCGPDPQPIVEAVSKFAEAGFTDVAIVQVGPDQKGFCDFYARTLRGAFERA
jgi:G6PDH family F420-dependent oxidoreductase